MSGGHLCEAEAPTEATAETSAPPEENETEINGFAQYKLYDNFVGRGLAPAVEKRRIDYRNMAVIKKQVCSGGR